MTDSEIKDIAAVCVELGRENFTVRYARAILAAHTAKLLAGVDKHRWKVLDLLPRGSEELDDAIIEYAAACAAQARMKALDEAKGVCLTIAEVALCTNKGEMARKTSATAESCAKAIESLKGKV